MTRVRPLRLPDDRLHSKTYRYFLKEDGPSGDWLATVMLDARGQVFWLTNGWGCVGYRWDAAGEIRAFLLTVNADYLFEKFATNIVGGLVELPCEDAHLSPEERVAKASGDRLQTLFGDDSPDEDEGARDSAFEDDEEHPGERQRRVLTAMIARVLPALQAALRVELASEAHALAYVAENVGVVPDAPYKAEP